MMSNRLASISMRVAMTVPPPCRGFVLHRRRSPSHPNPAECAKQNQQRNDFHFFLGGRKPKARGGKLHLIVHRCPHIGVGHLVDIIIIVSAKPLKMLALPSGIEPLSPP
jgi:hypothetical protein